MNTTIKRYICVAATLFALALPQVAAGQESLSPTDGVIQLSQEQVVALAIERNLGLKVERLRYQEAEQTLFGSHGIYDLNLTGRFSLVDETTPSASNLDGADIQIFERQGLDLGLSQLVSSGGTVRLNWNNFRRETNSRFSALNPQYGVDLDLSFTQPLLRDLGRLATERQILVAKNNANVSKETFERQLTETVSQAEQLYWNLVDALRQLEVDEEALTLADQLHEQNEVRVEVGTLAQLELVQSEVGSAQRREAVIRSQAAVRNAEDALRQLLNLEDALWSVPIDATTPAETETQSLDVEAGITSALEYRPELRSKRWSVDNLRIDEDYYRNQRLPRLDLDVTYGFNGVGGDITERDFITGEILFQAPGDYSDALGQVTDRDFEGWSAALNLTMPVQNRWGEAQSAIAELARERGEAELADLEAQIAAEVRRVARAVETAAALIESTTASRRLAEENLEAEEKRFENGLSTSYQVLEIQEDLTRARSNEVIAITGYRKAYVEYLRVTGQLLDHAGIEIVGEE